MTNNRVVIGGRDREQVTIRVLGRMHQGAVDYSDGNWLISPIQVSVGDFTGWVQAGLRAEELRTFRQELETLYETLEGEARLHSLEDWISLVCKGDG